MISTQRSYADFILKSREFLPQYFDFEGLGILFRDVKTNNLFSIEQTYNEVEIAELKKLDEKKKKGIILTKEEKL